MLNIRYTHFITEISKLLQYLSCSNLKVQLHSTQCFVLQKVELFSDAISLSTGSWILDSGSFAWKNPPSCPQILAPAPPTPPHKFDDYLDSKRATKMTSWHKGTCWLVESWFWLLLINKYPPTIVVKIGFLIIKVQRYPVPQIPCTFPLPRHFDE